MAVLGRLIRETEDQINIRQVDVIGDVIIEKNWIQIRTYSSKDRDREDGAKQNIQLNKEMAQKLRGLLDEFLNQSQL